MKAQAYGLKPQGLTALCMCLLIAMTLSVGLGQGTTWDTRNYHLYNPWALLNGHFLTDLGVAGRESYFNPLLDVPYYVMSTGFLSHLPRVLAAVQGLWYGGFVYVLLGIASRVAALRQRAFGVADVFAVLIGATGTMATAVIGETSNDMPVAMLTLLGLYLAMPLYAEAPVHRSTRRALIAGVCCGVAAGLKPTAAIYPPAIALALFLTLRPRAQGSKLALLYIVGVALGFGLSYGWWGWHLYTLTGNPLFPMFNQVFRSDWVAPTDHTDDWFRPRSVAQWLFYPFFWLHAGTSLVVEPKFADWRYAVAMLAVCTLALVRLFRVRRWLNDWHPVSSMLLVFVSAAYIFWLVLYSNLRYAIPIEALTGLVIMLALQTFTQRLGEIAKVERRIGVAMGILCAFFILSSYYPSYGRIAYGKRVFDAAPIQVETGSTVMFMGPPVAYLTLFFAHPENLNFVGVTMFTVDSKGYKLATLTRQKVLANTHSLYVVRRNYSSMETAFLFEFLPGYHFSACRPLQSNLEWDMAGYTLLDGLSLCRVTPIALTASASPANR